jgi:capsid portal protein
LFQNYSANNQDKVRRSFRLPPIFVGRSDDYTRATAHSSRQLADEQIFAPERDGFDARMNRDVFPDLGIVHHRYKSNSPNTTDNTELVKILAGSEKTGGMTPRIAKGIMEDILSITLPPFKEGYDPDLPFSLTMAAAVKNQADATEPGQQVTALKILGGGLEDQATGDPMIDHLLDVWKGLDTTWDEEVGDEHLDKKRPVSRKERNKKRSAAIKHEH